MRTYWMLRSGESIEVFDGQDVLAKDRSLVYRIGVERMITAEVKVVRTVGKVKIITRDSKSNVIDVPVSGALFIEVQGQGGVAFGWYEAVG